jgi:hypothetical protein
VYPENTCCNCWKNERAPAGKTNGIGGVGLWANAQGCPAVFTYTVLYTDRNVCMQVSVEGNGREISMIGLKLKLEGSGGTEPRELDSNSNCGDTPYIVELQMLI